MRPGGVLSSLGVYSGKLTAPYEAFYAGSGDQRIDTTLPRWQGADSPADGDGGHEPNGPDSARDARFVLEICARAYDLFSHQRDGVMKVAIHPHGLPAALPRAKKWLTSHAEPSAGC